MALLLILTVTHIVVMMNIPSSSCTRASSPIKKTSNSCWWVLISLCWLCGSSCETVTGTTVNERNWNTQDEDSRDYEGKLFIIHAEANLRATWVCCQQDAWVVELWHAVCRSRWHRRSHLWDQAMSSTAVDWMWHNSAIATRRILTRLANQISQVLKLHSQVQKLAHQLYQQKSLLVTGRGHASWRCTWNQGTYSHAFASDTRWSTWTWTTCFGWWRTLLPRWGHQREINKIHAAYHASDATHFL